jgi:hypothetical protein
MEKSLQLTDHLTFNAPQSKIKRSIKKVWGLKRLHLFEFCDQTWLKGAWREAYLDGLNTTFKMFKFHDGLTKPFNTWLSKSKSNHVLELCSGGGGPIDTLIKNQNSNKELKITLSDLTPDVKAFEAIKNKYPKNIDYVETSTDATNTKELNANLIFMCSSFHHFSPDMAKKILLNASKNSNGIFIREILSRNFFNMISSIFNLLPLMLTPFFSGRFTFFKLLITTIVPIVPLMIIFDGIVSVFRTYTTEEIMTMLPEEMKKNWHWTTGSNKVCGLLQAPFIYGIKS